MKIFFNKEQIEALIDDNYKAFIDKIDSHKKSVYCSVTAFGNDTDQKTTEEIQSFLSAMCEYFDLWSKQESNENFRAYFDNEIQRRTKIYQQNEMLSEKQSKIFVNELNKIKNQNLAENFDYE